MASMHGKRGVMTCSTMTAATVALLQSWTVNGIADIHDATVMDSSAVAAGTHWKGKLVGYKDWNGSCVVLLDSTGIGLATLLGLTVALTLHTTDGLGYSGNAFCTNVSIQSGDQAVSATVDFEGNGALTEAA